MRECLECLPLRELLANYAYASDYFSSLGMEVDDECLPLDDYLAGLPDLAIEDYGMARDQIAENFFLYMEKMEDLKLKDGARINEITVIGGVDKNGAEENISLVMRPGDIICLVGPTGSGKSRLLADIECLAQRDTPTRRQILIDGKAPAAGCRFSVEYKLVAQLSQNMNFIMDLSAGEFIAMHAESRIAGNVEEIVCDVIACANELAGEKFSIETPVTSLSGGQSRALMIADTALLSESPIVLIDEIENAGVDRKKALDLLVKKEKIALMATHDPILALMGDKRIVIKNGGIHKILETSQMEKRNLKYLQTLDKKMLELRNLLRFGEYVDFNALDFFYR